MPTALCSDQYNAPRVYRSQRGRHDIPWKDMLPPDWLDLAVAPVLFDTFRDYEVAADRTVGRDADGEPCYYAHHYAIHEARSDDDEEYYQVPVYREALIAWRLRDGRWLAWRKVSGEESVGRPFFSLGEPSPLQGWPPPTGPGIA